MKPLAIVLALLFLVLQYKLWFARGGITEVWHLRQAIAAQNTENTTMQQNNLALTAEVADLKNGQAAVEERARNELGMTKPDEVFYQIVGK